MPEAVDAKTGKPVPEAKPERETGILDSLRKAVEELTGRLDAQTEKVTALESKAEKVKAWADRLFGPPVAGE